MGEVERRAALGELRVEGRRIIGVVMRYGQVSPSHKERFEPGSFRMAATIHLDLNHDRDVVVAWHPDGGLTLEDRGEVLELSAELPPIPAADRALDEIRTGKTNGLSIEFRALKEGQVNGVRVIEEAELSGIGLVSKPSYEGSRVEARARKHGRLPRWL